MHKNPVVLASVVGTVVGFALLVAAMWLVNNAVHSYPAPGVPASGSSRPVKGIGDLSP